MNNIKLLVLLCAILAATCSDLNRTADGKVSSSPTSSMADIASVEQTSSEIPLPKSTTTTSTTTSSPNTTTVVPPTTHTPPNTTTVTPPTTHAPPPNTTTVAPPTTSTAAPTTPKPAPQPMVGNWTVDYPNSNKSCIVMQSEIEMMLVWKQGNKTLNTTMTVPTDATATGECGNETQMIVLTWNKNNTLQFDFVKTKDNKFEVKDIMTTMNVTLPNQAPKMMSFALQNRTEFPTPIEKSYKCMREQTLKLAEDKSNSTYVNLMVSHVQMQAFRNSDSHKFDSALDCDASVVNDTVPIVVGSILIVMIVMILAAYLLSRRRCQARGYLSM